MSATLLALALAVLPDAAPPAEFALRDGDTVVFLGDSITAARTYGKIIENYTLLRFPERKIRFYNAGWGGDTAAGGLKRLERDVFPHRPTVLIVAYGTNDIGWGLHADEEHRQIYLGAVRGIITECQKRKVRVFLCSAAVTAADPFRSEDSFLQKMCNAGMALAREMGEQGIDVQGSMREIQKRIWKLNERVTDQAQKVTMHAKDGAHLNDLGQLAMAYAILKGLGAPAEVSSVHIDARQPRLVASDGCQVSDVGTKDGTLSFTRLDRGLPFNYGLFYALNFLHVPFPAELNRYMLRVEHLPEGRYLVEADGRPVARLTAAQLSREANIASATTNAWQPGGPWDAQASVLRSLTDARHDLAIGGSLSRAWLKEGPVPEQLEPLAGRADEELIALQRLVARPRPYRFVIRKDEMVPGKKQPPGTSGKAPGEQP